MEVLLIHECRSEVVKGEESQSVAKCRGSRLGERPEGLPQPLLATLEQEAATLRRDATSSSEVPSLW